MLDTSTVSYVLKGSRPAVQWRLAKTPVSEVCISSVTEAELRYGLEKRPEATKLRRTVEEFLLRTEVLPWNSEAAAAYGRVRLQCERERIGLGNLDLLIAAHALATGKTLVTSDREFFKLKPLGCVDWSVDEASPRTLPFTI